MNNTEKFILTEQQQAKIREALDFVPCKRFHLWTEVGLILKNTGCPSAKGLWDEWSMKCLEKYNPQEQEKKWQDLNPKGNHLGLNNIFVFAKLGGWSPIGSKRQVKKSEIIELSPFEIKRKQTRVDLAERLILDLPENHSLRDEWLYEYGKSYEAQKIRTKMKEDWLLRDKWSNRFDCMVSIKEK